MVQSKHFKARIRERMAKTRESYTAARRQLLPIAPAAPGPVAGLLPGYRPQTAPTQRDAALWARVLAQAGVEARGPAVLAAARAGRKADKHWQAHVTGTGPKNLDAQENHDRAAIRHTAEALLSTHGKAGIPDRFSKNFGVNGIRTWAERLRDTRTRKGWPAMFADEQRRVQALTQVPGFLAGDEWSGPGALRPLYVDFLQEAAEIDGLAALRDVAPLYDALGTRWDGLADMIDPDCPPGGARRALRRPGGNPGLPGPGRRDGGQSAPRGRFGY